MAESNMETQIDCFLEQFKRSVAKAMEDRTVPILSNSGSHSSQFEIADSPDEPKICEEIEMVNTFQLKPVGVNDIADILHLQYAIISGGKSKDGCPIITFPDNNNFHLLNDYDYQRLMLYLTSVPSLQEADLGFHLIIDRRKDRWNSVKTVLLKISLYFPGLIQVVYVLRPASFLQKALSEVSNKLFKDEFKFRMIVLSTIDELHEYIDISQLTIDLGGTLLYSHEEWIQQRIELENFSIITQQISLALDEFTKSIEETELPNNVDSTQQLLHRQTLTYSELKEEILSAAKHGENLLRKIKEKHFHVDILPLHNSDMNNNIFAIERLLVQLEETERTFDEFWQEQSNKLRHCLELRQFEQDFRELQINFETHLRIVKEMNEIGDSIQRLEAQLKDMNSFEKLCLVDINRAQEVIVSGQSLVKLNTYCPLECVEPKCNELISIRDKLIKKLCQRSETIRKRIDFLINLEQANNWCKSMQQFLNEQNIDEKCTIEQALNYEKQFEDCMKTLNEILGNYDNFKEAFQQFISCADTKSSFTQVFQNIDHVLVLCDERMITLKNISSKAVLKSRIDILPKQPTSGAPNLNKNTIITTTTPSTKKFGCIPQIESHPFSGMEIQTNFEKLHVSPENEEMNRIKTGHVLAELRETEQIYVSELHSIIIGYKLEAKSDEWRHILPNGFYEKIEIIFGNLEEIFNFHSNIFLKDLENCISSTDLIALCFVQKQDTFFHLYSYYCQNIPRSEQIRETLTDCNMFFQNCQQKLGHKLPLAAYLLKPVQRITKYQLILKDLLHYSDEEKCCKEIQQALKCMLIVLKCVNDSMHQISITGFPIDITQQGDLLLQGSFSVWVDNKKDLKIRLKPLHRHIFLYQKSIVFCKTVSKRTHYKATYQFKHYLEMERIGLTESVRGDVRKFEIWLQGRQEVYIIQANNLEQKQSWVNEIKRVLLNQLEELKDEKIKQYSAMVQHKPLRQTTSWEKERLDMSVINHSQRTMSCDADMQINNILGHETIDSIETGNWSSDFSNSDDEEHTNTSFLPSGRYVALSDYCAVGNSEINMREGDMVELLKVGCAGWWFVKVIGTSIEGWAPAAYLDNLHRKASRSSSKSQDRLFNH